MEKETKETISLFLKHLGRYKISVFFSLLFYLGGVLLSNIYVPFLYKQIIDSLTGTADKSVVYGLCLTLLLLVGVYSFLSNVFRRLGAFFLTYWQIAVMKNLEVHSFESLQDHSFHFFSNTFSGSLVAKVNRLVRSFERMSDSLYWNLLPLLVTFVASTTVLYFVAPVFAFLLLGWAVLFVVITLFLFKLKSPLDLRSAEKDSKVTAELADAISNIFTIKMFSRTKKENEKFSATSEEKQKANFKSWLASDGIDFVQGSLMVLIEVALIFYALHLWNLDKISVGTLVLVQSYLITLINQFWGIGRITRDIFESLANSKEMVEILTLKIDVKDPLDSLEPAFDKGEIEFRNVDFSYGSKKVFDKFSLKIKAGESIGLVGESGSGKTTLTKLLLRFYDIDKGEIFIDGQNIAKLKQDDLRSAISYVPQDPLLFHRSLKENICYARDDVSEKEFDLAVRKAKVDIFVREFEKKYETLVGERGMKLSGGEKQRVAIARAMLKKSPLLILDEATSALDSSSEKYIQEGIENLMKKRTSIIIAHRLSTIRKVDRILVMDKGKIVEEGTHRQLLRKKGKYYELCKHQSGGLLPE